MGLLKDVLDLFGLGPHDVAHAGRRVHELRYEFLTWPLRNRRLKRASTAARDPLLTEYLASAYPGLTLLRVNGHLYPVTVFPFDGFLSQTGVPPTALHLEVAWVPRPQARALYFYLLQRSVIGKENRPTFVLKALTPAPLSLACGVADFFTGLRTSQALEWELHQAVGSALEHGTHDTAWIDDHLPFRRKLLQGIQQPWLDGTGRAAPVGISTLLAYREQSATRLLIRKRGPLSIVYNRGKWHVFPSGMFQAPYKDYDTEFSVLHAVLWEFLEELFDVPDPTSRRADPKWFYSEQPVAELLDMLSRGTAHLFFTGVAVNLASMRPEIMLALVLDDEQWFGRHQTGAAGATRFAFSRELQTSTDDPGTDTPVQRPFLPPAPEDLFASAELTPRSTVPVAAAAIYYGIRALRQHEGRSRTVQHEDRSRGLPPR